MKQTVKSTCPICGYIIKSVPVNGGVKAIMICHVCKTMVSLDVEDVGHESVNIPINGELVEVDAAIASLIKILNDYGIKTLASCAGDSRGYISIDINNADVWIGQVNGVNEVSVNLRFNTPKEAKHV